MAPCILLPQVLLRPSAKVTCSLYFLAIVEPYSEGGTLNTLFTFSTTDGGGRRTKGAPGSKKKTGVDFFAKGGLTN